MFILGAVLADYPLYAKCGVAVVWLLVGAVLLFLFLSILKPEPRRERGMNRADLDRQATEELLKPWMDDNGGWHYPTKEWRDPRIEREKWARENPSHTTLYSNYHPSGKVLKNGGKRYE